MLKGWGEPSMTFGKSQSRDAQSALGGVWLNGGTKIFKLSRARHAFTLIAMACQNKDRRLRFWCPAFFCNPSLGPLRQTSIEIVFYPVGPDLIPDWPACERLAAESPPDLFVLVHYFGSCNAIDQARSFCDRTGAKLIEDAAHLLVPAGGVGRVSDFVCYSPRKFFRIPDGGLLVVRDSSHAKRIQKLIGEMPERAQGAIQSRIGRLKRRLKRLLRPEAGQFQGVLMSGVAEQALERIVQRRWIARIAARRNRFEISVRAILKDVDRVDEINKAGPATSWMGLKCADEAAARLALDRLREGGIRAVNWPPHLPPEVYSQESLKRALHLRSTTIMVVRPMRSHRSAESLPEQPRHAQAPG